MEWIQETFGDLNDITITNYDCLSCGKKVSDCTGDYVIVYCDNEKNKINYFFKDK